MSLNRRTADERTLALLAEIDAARTEHARAVPRYVEALRRWAAYIKVDGENALDYSNAMLTAYDVADMTDRQIHTLLSRTDNAHHDVGALWRSLIDAMEAYYITKTKLAKANAGLLAYIQYAEHMENTAGEHDVGAAMLNVVENVAPPHLPAIFNQ